MHLEQRRIKLPFGKQKELIVSAAKSVGSIRVLSNEMKVPYSTLKKYSAGKLYLPEKIFNKLLMLLNIKKGNISFECLESNWGQIIGGGKGIRSLLKRHSQKMSAWRKIANQNSVITNTKNIKSPILDDELSEFIGVYLGDGTLTKYFLSISGDSRYDIDYFNYLSNLIYKLFNIKSTIKKEKNRNTLVLTARSVKLCSFLNREYNFKYGDKIRNNSLIPNRIMENSNLSIACLRGLVDTDGCVARHGNKLTIRFYSANPLLLDQVYKIASKIGVFNFHTGNQIGTASEEKIKKYFEIVGSSSLKSIVKFFIKTNRNEFVYQRDLPDYYKEKLFKSIRLPFKIKVS